MIRDKFTKLNISPQRRWQLRKIATGLCARCGKNPATHGEDCHYCYERSNPAKKRIAGV